ncbi:MAG: hypothetical protein NDI93_00915 [Pseudomonas sp.]|nr:hypothetical protein [Pseudomonas sp.]
MALPTQGSGTELDPWLITSYGELNSVLRDANGTGFYRIANDLDTGSAQFLSTVVTTTLVNYKAKVIDGNGYTVRFSSSQGTSVTSALFAGVHFRNIKIHATTSITGSYTNYLFYRCSLTDVAVYAKVETSSGPSTYLVHSDGNTPYIIPREVKRVLLGMDGEPAAVQPRYTTWSVTGASITQCYMYTTQTPSAGVTKLGNPPTLALLDGYSSGAFSDNGWWVTGLELCPWQSEQVAMTLQTLDAGAPVSRRLLVENEKVLRYLGDTDAQGLGQYNVRVRKWSSFSIYAAEDIGADALRADKLIVAGGLYLSPDDNGYVYAAGAAGRVTSLAGVTFADQPVVVDGITFTPRPRYQAAVSGRRSVAMQGSTQVITLDNAGGGGGPVIEGDPAYLEGLIEEVHPMSGTRRVMAGCEVIAFERRGSDYVAMGSAYSDGIGGFRLETQVYGGGDVFAFAADFPGVIFQPGATLNIGDRIRPALVNGYVYEITEAGTAGAEEPVWWPDHGDGTKGAIGTATAKARPYYQPVGHGPLKMTLM